MEMQTFVRKPFQVEAIEITEENMEELAEFIGTIRTKEDGTRFINVDRRLIPNIFRVYVGFYMTRMQDNIRCYSKKIFEDQFTLMNDEVEGWVANINAGFEVPRTLQQETSDELAEALDAPPVAGWVRPDESASDEADDSPKPDDAGITEHAGDPDENDTTVSWNELTGSAAKEIVKGDYEGA